MNTIPKPTPTYYTIAGLHLQVQNHSKLHLDRVFPSGTDFIVAGSSLQGDILADISLLDDPAPIGPERGTLLSDESIVWGNRFAIHELPDSYDLSILDPHTETYWLMRCSKDFRAVTIYTVAESRWARDIISWMFMVVYGQAGLAFDMVLIHASTICYQGDRAVAFLGKSGTGKSTHSRLWLSHIPDTELLNDDNPAVRLDIDGKVYIYGTPWSGKTPCYKNKKALLAGVVRLQQGPQNTYTVLKGGAAFLALLPSCTAIRWNKVLFEQMNTTVATLLHTVPVGQLSCLPNAEAAQLSFQHIFPG